MLMSETGTTGVVCLTPLCRQKRDRFFVCVLEQ